MGRETAVMTVFFMGWLLCGCSVETFFDGGAPLVVLGAFIAVAAAIMAKEGENDGPDNGSMD